MRLLLEEDMIDTVRSAMFAHRHVSGGKAQHGPMDAPP